MVNNTILQQKKDVLLERVNRFAAQHQKLFESQMTLGEHRDHLQRRHQELTQGVSDGLKVRFFSKFVYSFLALSHSEESSS